MSHEISEVTIDGQNIVEAMYANSPAWHGLGEVFDENGKQAPDSETAMRLAHLEWTVSKRPLLLAESQSSVKGFYAIARDDTEDVLGVVGERYQPFQNSEAFKFLDSLLQDGIMRYESAMALQGGRRVALLARLPSVDLVADNDPLMRYVLLSTSHDGSSAVEIQATSVRVVCANTLRMAMSGKSAAAHRYSFKHTSNARRAAEKARYAISQYDEAFTLFGQQARELLAKPLNRELSQKFIDELFPVPEDATKRKVNSTRRKIEAVRKGYRQTIQRNPESKATWWAMFNAVSWAVDHSPEFDQYRGTTRQRKENKFLSLTEGKGSELKLKAFNLALNA